MIQIHKIDNTEIIKSLALKDNFVYNKKNTYLGVFSDEEVVEYLCYSCDGKKYTILSISDKSGDFQLILGLVKTLIFLADIGMIELITMPLKYGRISKAIGFDTQEDFYELKINEYHAKCVKC